MERRSLWWSWHWTDWLTVYLHCGNLVVLLLFDLFSSLPITFGYFNHLLAIRILSGPNKKNLFIAPIYFALVMLSSRFCGAQGLWICSVAVRLEVCRLNRDFACDVFPLGDHFLVQIITFKSLNDKTAIEYKFQKWKHIQL